MPASPMASVPDSWPRFIPAPHPVVYRRQVSSVSSTHGKYFSLGRIKDNVSGKELCYIFITSAGINTLCVLLDEKSKINS